jgi:hypothetical protein
MYAFVVNNALADYVSSLNRKLADYEAEGVENFLRDVGTPSLVSDFRGVNTFNNMSGFYVYVKEGWAVRFKSGLVHNDSLSLGLGAMKL